MFRGDSLRALKGMKEKLPEFTPEKMREIQSRSSELAKAHILGKIDNLQRFIQANEATVDSDGDGMGMVKGMGRPLRDAQREIEGLNGYLAELEEKGTMWDAGLQLEFAKEEYKKINSNPPKKFR